MPENIKSLNRVSNLSTPFSIRLDRIASTILGLFLVYTGPLNDNLLVNFGGYFRLNFFEFFAIPIIFFSLITYSIKYGFWIKRYEQFLFLALITVLFSKILSLLVAEEVVTIQWAGIIRYVSSTLLVIYILANLLTDRKNRNFFIYGLIIGVFIESIGGLLNFILSGGIYPGYFLSVTSLGLQMFLILACMLAFVENYQRFRMILITLFLCMCIIATGSRGALVSLGVIFVIILLYALYSRRRLLRPIFAVTVIIVTLFLIGVTVPWTAKRLLWKIETGLQMKETSVVERLVLAKVGINMFLQHPLTGIGAGGIKEQQDTVTTFVRKFIPAYRGYRLTPHSTIVGIIGETGIIGIIAYLLWLIAGIGMCRRTLSLSKKLNTRSKILPTAASLYIIWGLTYGDIFSEASFYPIMNSLVGFVLGWLRDNKRHTLNTMNN